MNPKTIKSVISVKSFSSIQNKEYFEWNFRFENQTPTLFVSMNLGFFPSSFIRFQDVINFVY